MATTEPELISLPPGYRLHGVAISASPFARSLRYYSLVLVDANRPRTAA
jgi:hypothetical protein